MNAGIRTPAEVIGLVLEEADIPDFARVAERCAGRLAVALKSVTTESAEVHTRANPETGELEWCTVRYMSPMP